MTELLSLLVGMASGVVVCALLVLAIAWIWRTHFGRALVYFGLAEARDEMAASEAEPEAALSVGGRALGQTDVFAWPSGSRTPEPHS